MGLLRIRDFKWLFLSFSVSRLGTNFTTGALAVLVVLSSHGSPVAQAEIVAATLAPTAFFGWAAGVYVDRWDKRTSMIIADISRMVFITLVFFAHVFAWLLALAFLVNLLQPLYDSSHRSLMPIVVGEGEDFTRAIALTQSARNFLDVVGYGLGGAFIALLGTRSAFLFDAATYLASFMMVLKIQTRSMRTIDGGGPKPTFLQDLREGARAVFHLPVPRALLTQMAIACLPIGVYNALLILILPNVYHLSSKFFPYFLAVEGLAMVLGGLFLTKYPSRFPKRVLINGGLVSCGVLGALFALAPNAIVGGAVYFLFGLSNNIFLIPLITWYRTSLPSEVRGRGIAAYSSIVNLVMFLGTLIAAPLGETVGVQAAVIMGAAGFLMVGIAGFFARATRESGNPGLAEATS